MPKIMTPAAKTPKNTPGSQKNRIVPTAEYNINNIFCFLVNSYQYMML